jgi:hypothetical protein
MSSKKDRKAGKKSTDIIKDVNPPAQPEIQQIPEVIASASTTAEVVMKPSDVVVNLDWKERDKFVSDYIASQKGQKHDSWGVKSPQLPPPVIPDGVDVAHWKRERIRAVAEKYIGLLYRHQHCPHWVNAKGEKGVDCSNFTGWCYNYGLGIKFTGNVGDQGDGAKMPGKKIERGEPLKVGDMMYINKRDNSRISHVVLYLDDKHIIDSHQEGVYIRDFKGWYSTHYVHARRIILDDDITHLPSKTYAVKDLSLKEIQDQWNVLVDANKAKYPIIAHSTDDVKAETGIAATHDYPVVGVYLVKTDQNSEEVLELKSPDGKMKWKGAWAEGSAELTEAVKKQLPTDHKDTFFIALKDFVKYFKDFKTVLQHDNYHYYSQMIKTNGTNANYFRVKPTKDGLYYIVIDQNHGLTAAKDAPYSATSMILGKKLANGGFEYVASIQKTDREVLLEVNLKANEEYLLYAKVAFPGRKPQDFVLSSYGPDDINFNKLAKTEEPKFIESLYLNKAKASKNATGYEKEAQPLCKRTVEFNDDDGYGYFYYKNDSDKTLNEHVHFSNFKGLKLVMPYRNDKFEVKLAPKQEIIVLLKSIDGSAFKPEKDFDAKTTFA